jgi:hypothetical protein
VVFVQANSADSGSCTQSIPCGTLTYAESQVTGGRNVIKILGNELVVTGTQVYISGYIEGTSTVLSGSGSNGMLEIVDGNVVLSGLTLAPTDNHSAQVTGGQATFYDDTINGSITTTGGTLTIDRSVADFVECGESFGGDQTTPGTLAITRSELIEAVANNCPTSLQQNDFDETSLGPEDDQTQIEISGSATFHIENNVIVSDCSFTDPVILHGAAGSTYRFNTEVNLSGSDGTADILSCSSGIDASNNILAWHSSQVLECPSTYTLLDSLQAVPPGAGNQIGSAASFFVDMANKDFHLAAGSPALHGAQPGVDVSVDYDGNPRPEPANTNDDVGAFESPD